MPDETLPSRQLTKIEEGVFDIPIQLPESIEPQRAFYRDTLLRAQSRLRAFAQEHDWQVFTAEPFAHQVQIFADKAAFDASLLQVCGLDPGLQLPPTYCAALEQGILMAVSPELYRALYPQGDEDNAYEKLLTHEMAHRLHIRILGGNEDAMGPVWFFEGFALFAAGQFAHNAPRLEPAEIWSIVNDPDRGSYQNYAAVFQHFVRKNPLRQLVSLAGQADFLERLKAARFQ